MYLCLDCQQTSEPDEDAACCPKCGSTSVPADLATGTVSISITWHELRVLCMWAENWAGIERDEQRPGQRDSMRRTVYGIADRIAAQHLDRDQPLTMAGEFRGLRDAFGEDKVEVHGFDESIPPEP